MTYKHKRYFVSAVAAISAILTACGGGGGAPEGGIGGSGAPMGSLRMSITDAPSCGYDAVNITVDKVSVNQNAAAGDDDAGWVDIPVTPPQRLDLLGLTNGVLFTLGQTPLATGTYTQMRLVLASNTGADPLANSVVPTGGEETALKTPSAQQSGLKANVDITVAANQLADFVIDFDACKSVVKAGNSGQYILKPVIQVVPNYISGVAGFVDLSLAGGSTVVSLEQDGLVVKSTVPDLTGQFVLEPVAPGTYDLVITAPGRTTAVVTGVVVADALVTDVNAASADIMLPDSAAGTVAGTVTTGVVPVDANLAASQLLAGGTMIEVGALPADADTGAYAFTLPVAAPIVAPYVAGTALAFAPDTSAAGLYSLSASAGGAVKSAALPVLTTGATLTQSFTFP
jgi:hypothetical protein